VWTSVEEKQVTKEAIGNHHVGTQKEDNGVSPLFHSMTIRMRAPKSQHFLHYVEREEKVHGGVGSNIIPRT